jgi:hypothetical protein
MMELNRTVCLQYPEYKVLSLAFPKMKPNKIVSITYIKIIARKSTLSQFNATALICFPINLTSWLDSNQRPSVPEADVMPKSLPSWALPYSS